MVDVILIENTSDKVSYRYLVEGKEDDFGIIFYNKKTAEFDTEKEAPGDKFGSYEGHAFNLLEEFVSKSEFPDKDTEIWY